MTQAQMQVMDEIKTKRREEAQRLQERIAVIRQRITAVSGKWDAVDVLRAIRYGK